MAWTRYTNQEKPNGDFRWKLYRRIDTRPLRRKPKIQGLIVVVVAFEPFPLQVIDPTVEDKVIACVSSASLLSEPCDRIFYSHSYPGSPNSKFYGAGAHHAISTQLSREVASRIFILLFPSCIPVNLLILDSSFLPPPFPLIRLTWLERDCSAREKHSSKYLRA